MEGTERKKSKTMKTIATLIFLFLLILEVSGSRADDSSNSPAASTSSYQPLEGKELGEAERETHGRTGDAGQSVEVLAGSGGRIDSTEEEENAEDTTKRKAVTAGQLAAARLPRPEALQGSRAPLTPDQATVLGAHQTLQGLHLGRIPPSCALCSTKRNLCRIISGIFTRSPLPYGYSLVTPVPAGVCNLTISEMKPSKNFFALRRSDGTYALNGNWDIKAAGRYQAGGTTFLYTPAGEGHGEQLSAPGPLMEPIDFMLISQSPNPGIKYEYRVPLPEYVSGSTPGLGLPSSGLQSSAGLGPPTGGVRPNIAVLGNSGSNVGRSSVRTGPSHVTPFQPIPQGNTNIGARNPNFSLRNPAPGGSGLYPNVDGGSFAPLTPVLQPVGTTLQGTAFNSSLPFSSLSLQGGVGTNPSGSSRRNSAYPTIPLIPSSGQSSRGSPGLPRIHMHGQPLTPLGNPGSASFPLPMNPNYGSQDGSRIGVPLGTSFISGQQYPRVPGVAASIGSGGYPDSRFPGQGRTIGDSPLPGTSGIKRPSSPTTGHQRHHPLARPVTPSTFTTSHRTRHHHGSKGMQGQRKIHGKTPEHASFDPGVQLTQPKTSLSASGNRTVSTRPSRQHGGKKGRRRHHHQQDGSAEGGKRRRKDRDQRKGRSRFQWAEKGLTPCSRPCGGGNQTVILSCERRRKKKVVPDRRCSHLVRPQARVVLCNLTPCPAMWMPGEWGPCSVTCGMGVQMRKLMCKQVVSPTLTMMVPEGACLSPPSVPTSQVCETRLCNPEPIWETGSWTNCSAPCGLGTRGRQVSCVVAGVPVGEDQCSTSAKPTTEEVCDMGSCATNFWFVSDWSNQCSESCGTGIQTRRVHCLGGDQLCPAASRPDTTRPCLGESGCGGQWFTGVWNECSEPCGGGQEIRGVACMVSIRGRWRVTQEANCNAQDRPQDSRDCNLHPCTPQWFTSDWSQCSVSCDGGVMQREVTCLDTSLRASPDCLNTTRPAARQSCHLHSCTSQPALSQSTSPTLVENNDHQATDDTEDSGVQGNRDDSLLVTGSQDEIEVSTEEEGREEAMELENELVLEETTGSALNVIPDKDAQGDESVASSENGHDKEKTHDREVEEEKKKKRKRKKDRQKDRDRQILNNSTEISKTEAPNTEKISCIDRIKNCHLVFRARLCRLRYYNKLCCRTCISV